MKQRESYKLNEIILLLSTSLISSCSKLTTFIEHEHVREVDNHKILGVIIDKTLSWDKQIYVVCLNITRF